ncbi:MAG TPA: cupin domain-containing protein [Polyangiaceae bacterium]|nr:cupin domain-containing protein [Polyangiaceae bacterium]
MSNTVHLYQPADVAETSPEPGLFRKLLAHSPRLMLVEHRMVEGWSGARHRHPHEQLVLVLEGRLRVICGEDSAFFAVAGDSFVVPGGVEHQVTALTPARALDVFTPFRDDYLEVKP